MDERQLSELKRWIAHDPSDYARRVREAIEPAIERMHATMAAAADFMRAAERFDHRRRAVMRRKIRKLIS